MRLAALLLMTAACTESTTARLELVNQTDVPAPVASVRMKMLAVSLVEEVDPSMADAGGRGAQIWLNPECHDDNAGCNVEGVALPKGPRVTQYVDLGNPVLAADDVAIEPGTYRFARIEMCRAETAQALAMMPTLMWRGPGMTYELPFTSGDCAETSLPLELPLAIAAGDAVTVTLAYDLAQAVVSGRPDHETGHCTAIADHLDADGQPHCFRTCVDPSPTTRVCLDLPALRPTVTMM